MTTSCLRAAALASTVWLVWSALPAPIRAQAVDVDVETAAPDPNEQPYYFSTGYGHMFSSDITGGGSVARDSFQAGLGGRFNLTDSLSLNTRLIYELNSYGLTQSAGPFQWQNVHQYTLLALLGWKLNESWSLLGGPLFRLAGEGSSVTDNADSLGLLAGFAYKASPDLQLGLALGVLSQIEDDPALIPIPTVRWHFAEPLTFKFGIDQLGGRTGLGPELVLHMNPKVDLSAGVQYERRRFRLDDHGANRKGVAEDTVFPIYARLAFHPMPAATMEVFAGVDVGGELTIQDKNGGHTFDRGYDSAPTLGLRGEYRF